MEQTNEMRARELDESFLFEMAGVSVALWFGRQIWLVDRSEAVLKSE